MAGVLTSQDAAVTQHVVRLFGEMEFCSEPGSSVVTGLRYGICHMHMRAFLHPVP